MLISWTGRHFDRAVAELYRTLASRGEGFSSCGSLRFWGIMSPSLLGSCEMLVLWVQMGAVLGGGVWGSWR